MKQIEGEVTRHITEIHKRFSSLFGRNNLQDSTDTALPEAPIPYLDLPFDERWDKAISLQPAEKRRFLSSELMSIIDRYKDGHSDTFPLADFKAVHLSLSPSELKQSQLPNEIQGYLLDHYNDPNINRYRSINANGSSIKLWGKPYIMLTVFPERIDLETGRSVPEKDFLGVRQYVVRGRDIYVSVPSPNTNFSLAAGIKSDFEALVQRGEDEEIEKYIGSNRWIVAKELTRFATDAVISRRQS
jgi:hypothetical protein